jgi:hypothetical protein
MEINTVPRFDGQDARGVVYSKIPKLQFLVDDQGKTLLVQDVTYYSKAALYDAFKAWRNGEPACSGRFDEQGAWKSCSSRRPEAWRWVTSPSSRANQRIEIVLSLSRLHWDHELGGVGCPGFSLLPRPDTLKGGQQTDRVMESRLSLSRLHWDHEPSTLNVQRPAFNRTLC